MKSCLRKRSTKLTLLLYQKSICFSAFFSFDAVIFLGVHLLLLLDELNVLFVRWFRAPFFEQVVFAVGVLEVTSGSDEIPVVKRHFRIFD